MHKHFCLNCEAVVAEATSIANATPTMMTLNFATTAWHASR